MQDSTIHGSRTTSIVLAATILGSSMAFLDGTVVNLALPDLQKTYAVDISVCTVGRRGLCAHIGFFASSDRIDP